MSDGAMDFPVAIYVHVPFCVRRCHYCDFAVSRARTAPIGGFLAALAVDLNAWEGELGWQPPVAIDTLYIGGGTPSLLGAGGMSRLAELLASHFSWSPDDVEWTAEANPGSLTDEVCARWRELGVTRLSLGVQSFDDRALRWLGRLHDSAGAQAAIERARAAGFPDLNVDLIFGLPESVPRDWGADLDRAVELGANHVSAYGLTAEPRTPLGRRVALGREQMPGDERYESEFLFASDRLGELGFDHYEVSNYARPARQSRHNWHYWIGSSYLGLGPSSHSFVRGERIWNVRGWDAYRTAAREGRSLREGRERPTGGTRRLEELWLGLRTIRGVTAPRAGTEAARTVDRWNAEGWALVQGDRLRLTPAGWLRMDALVAELAVQDGLETCQGSDADPDDWRQGSARI